MVESMVSGGVRVRRRSVTAWELMSRSWVGVGACVVEIRLGRVKHGVADRLESRAYGMWRDRHGQMPAMGPTENEIVG